MFKEISSKTSVKNLEEQVLAVMEPQSTPAEPGEVGPDLDMIATYTEVVFGYCEGFAPVRALAPQSPCLSGIAWPAFVPPFHVASTSGGAIAPEQPGHHSRLGVRTSRVREWIHSLGRGDHSLIQTAGQIARITEAAAATALCLGYHQARRVIS